MYMLHTARHTHDCLQPVLQANKAAAQQLIDTNMHFLAACQKQSSWSQVFLTDIHPGLLQPAIFALVCVVFGITFKEIPPPIHPKTQPDLHVVVPIQDSCYEDPLADKADGAVKTPRVLAEKAEAAGRTPRALLRNISHESKTSNDIAVVSSTANTV